MKGGRRARSEAVGFFADGASPHRGRAVSAGWSASSPPAPTAFPLRGLCLFKISLIFFGFWFTIEGVLVFCWGCVFSVEGSAFGELRSVEPKGLL